MTLASAWAYLLAVPALSSLTFLDCRMARLAEDQRVCREVRCEGPTPGAGEECLDRRARACYCLTYLGATEFRENHFKFAKVAIHGHYCGWRSAHRGWAGQPLDWDDRIAVRRADEATRGIDALDEICRQHDIDYDREGLSLCEADRRAISAFGEFAHDPARGTPALREQGLVLERALRLNRATCHVLGWLRWLP